jgi:hypothetical protein
MMGDFVTHGAPLVRVQGDGARLDRERVRRLIVLDDERTHRGDPAYGFRKLVDVAQRALGTRRTTRRPPSRSSTACTTACGRSQTVRLRTVTSATRTTSCG